jgi:hypothetical protein
VAQPPTLHDVACVMHLHSRYSDGTGSVPQIARAGRRAGVEVVLLTDHDTLKAKERGEERWYGPVLVLVGEEVSPKGGNHYLAFGIDRKIDHRGMSPAGICEAVRDAGGFGFAAHPFSRGSERFQRGKGMPFRDLDCEALEGIELWSFATDTGERLPGIPAAIRFLAAPNRVLDHPPEENVAGWERLCAERRVAAIGGLDAHQFGLRVGPFVPLRLMSYKRSFRQIRTHALCEEPLTGELEHDREQVYAALREGRCYIAVDALGEARGFRFWAEGPKGILPMGAEGAAGKWTLHALLPRPAEMRLLRDGAELASSAAPALVCRVSEPGVYRVEARVEAFGAERTWILSNPIYLRA